MYLTLQSRQVIYQSKLTKKFEPTFKQIKDLLTPAERKEIADIIIKILKRQSLEEEEQTKINKLVDTLITAGIIIPIIGMPVALFLKGVTLITPIETKYSLRFLKDYLATKISIPPPTNTLNKLPRKDIKTMFNALAEYLKK